MSEVISEINYWGNKKPGYLNAEKKVMEKEIRLSEIISEGK